MTSYNAINGTPSLADTYTANQLAQRTYGFDGYITSDCGAVGTTTRLPRRPRLGAAGLDHRPATARRTGRTPRPAQDGLRRGRRPGVRAARRHRSSTAPAARTRWPTSRRRSTAGRAQRGRHRQRPGPSCSRCACRPASSTRPVEVAYTKITKAQIQSPAHQALARKVADNSLVLLKNDAAGRHPAAAAAGEPGRKLNNVVIVGDLANTVTLGDYSGDPTLQVERGAGHHRRDQGGQPDATVTFDAVRHVHHRHHAAALLGGDHRPRSSAPTWSWSSPAPTSATAERARTAPTIAMPGNYDSLIDQVTALRQPEHGAGDPVRRPGRPDRQRPGASSRPSCSAATTARARAPRWPTCCSASRTPTGT